MCVCVQYELTLYKDRDYSQQLTRFPASVDDKQTLYVKASLTGDQLADTAL